MTDNLNRNLAILFERGVSLTTTPESRTLQVARLDLDTAVRIGHALTIQLDARLGSRARYTAEGFPLEPQIEAAQKKTYGIIFGEVRPDNRNLAVRVESACGGHELTADVRNDYEDKPELDGGRLIRIGFFAALAKLELE